MIDQAFFVVDPKVTAASLALACGGHLLKPELSKTEVTSVASMEMSGEGDLTFCEKDKPTSPEKMASGSCITTEELAPRFADTVCVIVHPNPRLAFTLASSSFISPRDDWAGEKNVHESAHVPDTVQLGPTSVISADVKLGEHCRVLPGAFIGPGVTIGRNCFIGPNASVRFSHIGDNVTIGGGTIVGEIGFGLSIGPAGAVDTPHFGRVIIQDDVSIGANVCVDRGLLQDTVIGQNAKIDNLCQIAHNVQLGAHTVVAACCGMAGSAIIGDGAQFGGMAGVMDHTSVGAGARLAGASTTMHSIPDGETWGGFPAKPIKTWMREVAWLARNSKKRNNS